MKYIILLTLGLFSLSSCSTLFTYPDDFSQKQRFAFFKKEQAPIKSDLKIYWDKHSIPFIESQTDEDLAFGIGVAQAHLRLGQMEVFRLLTQGRLSEVAGPIPQVNQLDQALRMFNFKRAGKESIKKMTPEAKMWFSQFLAGINWYIEQMGSNTKTNEVLDIDLKPYTIEELAAISRLVTADITWGTYIKYLKLSENPDWEKIYYNNLEKLKTDSVTFNNQPLTASFILQSLTKSGSNSVVISKKKTRGGSAMIASDPHVGLILPNFWVLLGIKSPSYHAVGYMIPGTPIIGVGRNPDIAWGGTNMRGISSHLYDVSDIDKNAIRVRQEKITRRWWTTSEVEIRETEFGPIITDSPFFDTKKIKKDIALNWIGRSGGNDLQSFLDAQKATNWQEFKNAFKDYQVPAMNMLYADRKGNIGMVAAYGQPVLKDTSQTLQLIKKTDNPIVEIKSPVTHPNPYNPAEGFLASANNRPFSHPKIPFAYSFSNNDRVDRIKELMREDKDVHLEKLKKLQLDVFSDKAHKLAKTWVKTCAQCETSPLFESLKNWDGHFTKDSSGALAFYIVAWQLWQEHLTLYEKKPLLKKELSGIDRWKDILTAWTHSLEPQDLKTKLQSSLKKGLAQFKEFKNWGGITKQARSTVFGFLPVIGSRFNFESIPISGSSDTLNKYGRPFKIKDSDVFYGASARHISDLSDIDENYFAMNGGQDAWLNNENMKDQIDLFHKGEYIKVPLTMSKVRGQFNAHVTYLKPKRQ